MATGTMVAPQADKSRLTFRAGDRGFVFYDDTRFTGEVGRTWAFSTIAEAASWLVGQFPTPESDDVLELKEPASAEVV